VSDNGFRKSVNLSAGAWNSSRKKNRLQRLVIRLIQKLFLFMMKITFRNGVQNKYTGKNTVYLVREYSSD